MRVVRAAHDLPEALVAARREAAAAFGDDRLLLERYVERPRHVEVQILGDAHGTLVHLGERECSIQRRHQKLVEESPSPVVTPAMRGAMGEAALRLARAAGYRNAGTVEFLLDARGAFFFLEVNARLQVEHPVTEAVTGLDLVEQQLRVAAGEPLGFGQADVRLDGAAIEVRVVAEDAAAGFLPATGVVTAFDVPGGVRVDTGVGAGSVISPFYDSLVAKVIAHGADRTEALVRLADALDGLRLEGVASNVDLLAAVLAEPAFTAGDLHTGFLEEHRIAEGLRTVVPRDRRRGRRARARSHPFARGAPWAAGRPWRMAGVGETTRWIAGDRSIEAVADRTSAGTGAVVRIDGAAFDVVLVAGDGAGWTLLVDGEPAFVRPAAGGRIVDTVTWHGRSHRLRLAGPPSPEALGPESDEADALSAPMPGRIVRLHVAEGDHVGATDPLLVLEAMKMEHVIAATAPGRVARVFVAVGDQVGRGEPLIELVPAGDGPEGDD